MPKLLADWSTLSPEEKTKYGQRKLPWEEQAPEAPEEGGEFGAGVSAGWEETKGLGAGLVGTGGTLLRKVGLESIGKSMESWGQETYTKKMEEAAALRPGTVTDLADVEDVGGFIDWAQFTLGKLVPYAATSIVGGGVGAALGRTLIRGGMKRTLGRIAAQGGVKTKAQAEIVEAAAKRVGIARNIGVGATTAGLETGGIYGNIAQETGQARPDLALLYGIPAGMLDAILPGRILKKTGVGEMALKEAGAKGVKEATKPVRMRLLREVGKEVGKTVPLEAGTEVAQEILEEAAVQQAKGKLGTKEGWEKILEPRKLLEAGAAGALGGFAFGGGAKLLQEAGVDVTKQVEDKRKVIAEEEKKAKEEARIAEEERMKPRVLNITKPFEGLAEKARQEEERKKRIVPETLRTGARKETPEEVRQREIGRASAALQRGDLRKGGRIDELATEEEKKVIAKAREGWDELDEKGRTDALEFARRIQRRGQAKTPEELNQLQIDEIAPGPYGTVEPLKGAKQGLLKRERGDGAAIAGTWDRIEAEGEQKRILDEIDPQRRWLKDEDVVGKKIHELVPEDRKTLETLLTRRPDLMRGPVVEELPFDTEAEIQDRRMLQDQVGTLGTKEGEIPSAESLIRKTQAAMRRGEGKARQLRLVGQRAEEADGTKPFGEVNEVDPDTLEDIERLATQAGWAEEGGRLLRNEKGEVTGRTAWIPKAEWFLPENRPEGVPKKNVEARVKEVIGKLKRKEKLTRGDRGIVNWLRDVQEQMGETEGITQEPFSPKIQKLARELNGYRDGAGDAVLEKAAVAELDNATLEGKMEHLAKIGREQGPVALGGQVEMFSPKEFGAGKGKLLKTTREVTRGASEIRGDQGQVRQGRRGPEGLQDQGSQNLQFAEKERRRAPSARAQEKAAQESIAQRAWDSSDVGLRGAWAAKSNVKGAEGKKWNELSTTEQRRISNSTFLGSYSEEASPFNVETEEREDDTPALRKAKKEFRTAFEEIYEDVLDSYDLGQKIIAKIPGNREPPVRIRNKLKGDRKALEQFAMQELFREASISPELGREVFKGNRLGVLYPRFAKALSALIQADTVISARRNAFLAASRETEAAEVRGETRGILVEELGEGVVSRLERVGLLKILPPEEFKKARPGISDTLEGFWDKETGEVIIKEGVADPVSLFFHEGGEHASMDVTLWRSYGSLQRQLVREAEKGDPLAIAAAKYGIWARDEYARRNPEATGAILDEVEQRERLARYIQKAKAADIANPRGLLKRIIDAIRAWFRASDFGQRLARMGIAPKLTPGAAIALAKRSFMAELKEREFLREFKLAKPVAEFSYNPAYLAAGKSIQEMEMEDYIKSMEQDAALTGGESFTGEDVELDDFEAQLTSDEAKMDEIAGRALYGDAKITARVSLKELFQNSVDAVRAALAEGTITEGKVDITWDQANRKIRIQDNGTGMPKWVMQNKFVEVGGSWKPNARGDNTGSFGIAKLLFLRNNTTIHVESVHNGIKTIFDSTGEDIGASRKTKYNPNPAPLKFRRLRTADPNGTIIEATFPAEYHNKSTDRMEQLQDIGENFEESFDIVRREEGFRNHGHAAIANSPIFNKDIEVTFNGTAVPVGKNFPLDRFAPVARVNFPAWGYADIYVTNFKRDTYGDPNVRVVLNGIWQFNSHIWNNPFNVGQGTVERVFIVDVHTKLKGGEDGYPIAPNRQDFAASTLQGFANLTKQLSVMYREYASAEQAANYGNLQFISKAGKLSKTKQLVDKNALAGTGAKTQLRFKKGEKLTVTPEGKVQVNGKDLPELSPQDLEQVRYDPTAFRVPQGQVSKGVPVVHNNLVVPNPGVLFDEVLGKFEARLKEREKKLPDAERLKDDYKAYYLKLQNELYDMPTRSQEDFDKVDKAKEEYLRLNREYDWLNETIKNEKELLKWIDGQYGKVPAKFDTVTSRWDGDYWEQLISALNDRRDRLFEEGEDFWKVGDRENWQKRSIENEALTAVRDTARLWKSDARDFWDDLSLKENERGQVSLPDAAEKLYGKKFTGFVSRLTKAMEGLRDILLDSPDKEKYLDLTDYAFGVTFNNSNYGVHTRIPFQAILLNPAMREYTNKPIELQAMMYVGTMIHELAHIKAPHGVRYSGADPFADAFQETMILLQYTDERAYKRILNETIANLKENEDVAVYLAEKIHDYATSTVGTVLTDSRVRYDRREDGHAEALGKTSVAGWSQRVGSYYRPGTDTTYEGTGEEGGSDFLGSFRDLPIKMQGNKAWLDTEIDFLREIEKASKGSIRIIDAFGGTGIYSAIVSNFTEIKTRRLNELNPWLHGMHKAFALNKEEVVSEVDKLVKDLLERKPTPKEAASVLMEKVEGGDPAAFVVASNVTFSHQPITPEKSTATNKSNIEHGWSRYVNRLEKGELLERVKEYDPGKYQLTAKDGWRVASRATFGDVVLLDPNYFNPTPSSRRATALGKPETEESLLQKLEEINLNKKPVFIFHNTYTRKLENGLQALGWKTFKLTRKVFSREIEELAAIRVGPAPFLGSFAGPLAESANLDALEHAKELIKKGEDADWVRRMTGWFQGSADKMWRFEITDQNASLNLPLDVKKSRFWSHNVVMESIGANPDDRVVALDELLSHDLLFAAYPGLRDIPVIIVRNDSGSSTDPTQHVITLGWDTRKKLSNLMHEVQHMIQDGEGFASGGGMEDLGAQAWAREQTQSRLEEYSSLVGEFIAEYVEGMKKAEGKSQEIKERIAAWERENLIQSMKSAQARLGLKYDQRTQVFDVSPREYYTRLAGEVESRNTEERLAFDENLRKLTPPDASADVPPNRQIVTFTAPDPADTWGGRSPLLRRKQGFFGSYYNPEYVSDFELNNRMFRGQDKTLVDKGRDVLERWIRPGGLLQHWAPGSFAEKIRRDAHLTTWDSEAERMIRTLEQELTKEEGVAWRNIPAEKMREVDAALRGDNDALKKLSGKLQPVVAAMRSYLDKFSKEYMKILREARFRMEQDLEEEGLSDAKKERMGEALEAKQKLLQVIEGNLGKYIHRSYRMFDDKNWWKNIPSEVLDNARNFLLREKKIDPAKATTEEVAEVDHLMHQIVRDGTAFESLESWIRQVPLGKKDLTILMHKDEIADPILELMGVYTDPRMNFAKTAAKLTRLVANQRFLERLVEIGTQSGWLFKKGKFDEGGRIVPVPLNADQTIRGGLGYDPLAGYLTYPEVAQGLMDAVDQMKWPAWMEALSQVTYVTKYAKTIASPAPTGIRNYLSALMGLVANADLNWEGMKEAGAAWKEYILNVDLGKQHERLKHLGILGVSLDTPYAGEMMDLRKEIKLDDSIWSAEAARSKKDPRYFPELFWRATVPFRRGLERSYQFGDDFIKISAFHGLYNTLDGYIGAKARAEYDGAFADTNVVQNETVGKVELHTQSDMENGKVVWSFVDNYGNNISEEGRTWNSREEAIKHSGEVVGKWHVEKMAAERVRNTYMTYSLVGRLPRFLRKFPLTGTFVSFPVEMLRTVANMVHYLRKDFADPDLRPMALKRLVGMTIAATMPYVLTSFFQGWFDVDDEEMEAARIAVPRWNQLSNLIPTGRAKDGSLELVDFGYVDLYSLWRLLPNALLNGDPIDEDMWNVSKEFLLPFFGLDITSKAIYEVMVNESIEGGRLWNPADSAGAQAKAIAGHLLKATSPSTLLQFEKMLKANDGYRTRSGQKLEVGEETAALFGWKTIKADSSRTLWYGKYEFQKRREDATGLLSKIIGDPNPVTDQELRDTYVRARIERMEAYEEILKRIGAARVLGASEYQIRRELSKLGIAQRDIPQLIKGKVPKWIPDSRVFLTPEKKAEVLYTEEIKKAVRERRKKVLQYIREGERKRG